MFWWIFLEFSLYSMSSANSGSFTSSCPISMYFTSFYCLIAVARTSNTMLNRSDCRHPCLVPDIRRKAFSLLLNMLLAVSLLYIAFITLQYVPYIPTLLKVYHKRIWNFCQMLFLHPFRWWLRFLSFILLMWYMMLIDLQMLNHSCIPGINPCGHGV